MYFVFLNDKIVHVQWIDWMRFKHFQKKGVKVVKMDFF